MASSSDERRRTVCGACDLPFYAEKAECPYCGSTAPSDATPEESGFVFGNDAEGNGRTACEACGLPYYEDADGCPYCEYAGTPSDEETSRESPSERPADDRASTESTPGLFGRIKAALGL